MAKTIDIYNEAKRREPDVLVLLRCDNFYETYNKDAETCSKVLNLAVKSRDDGTRLTGIYFTQLEDSLPQLIRAGHRVRIIDGGRDTLFIKVDEQGDIVFTEKKTSNNNNQKTTTTMEQNFAAMSMKNVYWFNRDREALVQLVLVRSNFYLDSHKARHEWAEKDGDPKKIVLMTDYDPETPDELPRFYATTEAFEKGEIIKHDGLYCMDNEQDVCIQLLKDRTNRTPHTDEKGTFVWAFVKGQAVKWYFRKHIDVVTWHYENGCLDRATCDADGGVPENYSSCEEVYDYNDWTEVRENGERVKHEGVYNRLRLEPDQEELAGKLQQAIDACKEAGMDIYFNYASYDLNAVNVRHIESLEYDPSVDEETEEAHCFDDSRVAHVFKNVGDLNSEDSAVKFVIKKQ